MKIFFTLFKVVLLVVSVFHLYACIKGKEKIRRVTKCLLMPTIILIIIFSEKINLYLIIGLIFSLLGDFFLLWNTKKKFFVFGLFSFLICHIFYIIAFISKLSYDFNLTIYLIFIGVGIIFVLVANKITSKNMKKLSTICNLYAYIIFTGIVCSALLIIDNKDFNSNLVLFGYLLFMISDSTLAYTTFKKDIKYSNFYIMMTYILAQFLINMGLLYL